MYLILLAIKHRSKQVGVEVQFRAKYGILQALGAKVCIYIGIIKLLRVIKMLQLTEQRA